MITGDVRRRRPDIRACSAAGGLNTARSQPEPSFRFKALAIVCIANPDGLPNEVWRRETNSDDKST
jgi:hypothetical protein